MDAAEPRRSVTAGMVTVEVIVFGVTVIGSDCECVASYAPAAIEGMRCAVTVCAPSDALTGVMLTEPDCAWSELYAYPEHGISAADAGSPA